VIWMVGGGICGGVEVGAEQNAAALEYI